MSKICTKIPHSRGLLYQAFGISLSRIFKIILEGNDEIFYSHSFHVKRTFLHDTNYNVSDFLTYTGDGQRNHIPLGLGRKRRKAENPRGRSGGGSARSLGRNGS